MNRFEHDPSTDRPESVGRSSSADDAVLDSAIEVGLRQVFGGGQPPVELADRILQAWQSSEDSRRSATAEAMVGSGEFLAGESRVARAGAPGFADASAGVSFGTDSQEASASRSSAALSVASRGAVAQPTPSHAWALAASLAVLVVGATLAGYLVSRDPAGSAAGSRGTIGALDAVHSRGLNLNTGTLESDVGPQVAEARNATSIGSVASNDVALPSSAGGSTGSSLPERRLAGSGVAGSGVAGSGIAGSGMARTGLPEKSVEGSRTGLPAVVKSAERAASTAERAVATAGSRAVSSRTAGPATSAASVADTAKARGRAPNRDLIGGAAVAQRRGPWGEHDIVAWVNSRLEQGWVEANVTPAARAADEDWCRRLFLRVLGRIPTVAEVREFLAESSPDKREQWAQRLTACDSSYASEFASHWAEFWATTLVGMESTEVSHPQRQAATDRPRGSREQLVAYLVDRFQSRTSLERIAVELLGATGSTRPDDSDFNPAVNFLVDQATGPRPLAVSRVSRVFLGRNLQCVECHGDAEALTAVESLAAEKLYREISSDLRQLRVTRVAAGGVRLSDEVDASERSLAETPRQARASRIAASPEFARAVVNRVWSHFLGFGLVNPVDEITPANAPSHPELLETLAGRFVEHRYDLAALVRWIALSDAFGLSSRSGGDDGHDAPEVGQRPLFSRYYARPMRVEQLYESLRLLSSELASSGAVAGNVTGAKPSPERFLSQRIVAGRDAAQRRAFFTAVAGRFELGAGGGSPFDDPQAIIESVPRSLITADTELPRRVFGGAEESLVSRVIGDGKLGLDDKVRHLFQAAVARLPSAVEAQAARDLVAASPIDPAIGLRDLWWALLNSNEFLLDH
ncbi:MAG: hypothetical protein RLY70_1715 [Planctomycetota bacterium]